MRGEQSPKEQTMNKKQMRRHNLDIHCNALGKWKDIGTSRTYKVFKPKNRDFEDWFDFLETENRKELAKIRKRNVKARKRIKAKHDWCRKIKERHLEWFDWFNWFEAKKSSNNWRKTR